MKKSEMYKRVIAVIVRECSAEDMFEELNMLFDEYNSARRSEEWKEEREKIKSEEEESNVRNMQTAPLPPSMP